MLPEPATGHAPVCEAVSLGIRRAGSFPSPAARRQCTQAALAASCRGWRPRCNLPASSLETSLPASFQLPCRALTHRCFCVAEYVEERGMCVFLHAHTCAPTDPSHSGGLTLQLQGARCCLLRDIRVPSFLGHSFPGRNAVAPRLFVRVASACCCTKGCMKGHLGKGAPV